MKKLLLAIFLLLFALQGFSQQFSQYNTGTLYDSFENPAQRTFIPDSSKMFASNFLVPNFNFNFFLTGDAQSAAKSRLFQSYYNTADLQVGQGKFNHLNLNMNNYSIMFKMYPNFNGNAELGFSLNTKVEAKGIVSDETLALLNGPGGFTGNTYANVFNDNFYYQIYQQIGFSYREEIDKDFAIGIKLNALSGVSYDKVEIDQSYIAFDKLNDAASLALQGSNYSSGNAGKSFAQNLLPTFRNPGVSVSIGATYKTEDGFTIQGNIKDLGFIHWNKTSNIYSFNNIGAPVTIHGLSTSAREDSIYNAASGITTIPSVSNKTSSFTTPTNGLAELSATHSYWFGADESVKFSPTLIASKELFYTGFTGALVAPFQYKKYVITLTSSYTDLNLFNFGAQFMIKTPNSEFFIGSERLFQTISIIRYSLSSVPSTTMPQVATNPTGFTGMDFFVGFAIKFGDIIEPNMNSSSIPNGEKGFIGKLWDKLFPSDPVKNH